jgi:hypothetical protein
MLYRAKSDKDIGVKGCKVVGIGDVFGYELVETYFVDNSGFGASDEPALTFNSFLDKVKTGYFYGIREVGQFQVYIGEYRKLARQEIKKNNPDIISSKKVKNNTRLTIYKNGDKILRLHNTDIIKWQGNKIILNSGGWLTSTTKSRLNEFLADYSYCIYQKNFKWYIDNGGQDRQEFFDGIELDKTGK